MMSSLTSLCLYTCPKAEVCYMLSPLQDRKTLQGWTTTSNDDQQCRRPAMTKTTKKPDNNNEHEYIQQQPWHRSTTTMTPNNRKHCRPTATILPTNNREHWIPTTTTTALSDRLTFCWTDWHLVRIQKIKSCAGGETQRNNSISKFRFRLRLFCWHQDNEPG